MILRKVSDHGAGLRRGDIIYNWGRMSPVVALPGDSIELTDCHVLVNGEDQTQAFAGDRGRELCGTTIPRFALPDSGVPYVEIYYQGGPSFQYTSWDNVWQLRLVYWPPSQWRYFP